LTWDHVLPESWYPKGAGEKEKWQVPSCEPCNKRLGKIEENLLIKLGLCLDPSDLKSLGIPDRILRALNPSFGKNERDRKHRLAKREKVIREVKVFQDLPQHGIFPNFGPLPDQEYQEYPAVMLEEDEINQFAEKIIRGIAYIANNSFIDESYEIKPYAVDEQNSVELRKLVDSTAIIFDRRPGLMVKQSLVEDNKVAGIYLIEIWERFRMYVVVTPKDLVTKLFGA
jgi:hypothetical protein